MGSGLSLNKKKIISDDWDEKILSLTSDDITSEEFSKYIESIEIPGYETADNKTVDIFSNPYECITIAKKCLNYLSPGLLSIIEEYIFHDQHPKDMRILNTFEDWIYVASNQKAEISSSLAKKSKLLRRVGKGKDAYPIIKLRGKIVERMIKKFQSGMSIKIFEIEDMNDTIRNNFNQLEKEIKRVCPHAIFTDLDMIKVNNSNNIELNKVNTYFLSPLRIYDEKHKMKYYLLEKREETQENKN